MKNKGILLMVIMVIIFTFFIVYTCKKEEPERYGVDFDFFNNYIYKSKMDYSKYVAVAMSNDKKSIIGYPSPKDNGGDTSCHIITLTDNYYMPAGCLFGINTGFLSITRLEFQELAGKIKAGDYINYILDADPFLEYYKELPCDSCLRDTASINNAIRNNELEKYYKRLK